MSCRFSRRLMSFLGSNGHMTDPFLRCHRDLDLDLCDFWVMNLKIFEVNQGEMNSMEFWLDVSSSNEPYLIWLQVKWKMAPSNISFLSFRVIFHWTMSMGERWRKGRSRSVASLSNCFGRSFSGDKSAYAIRPMSVCARASSKKGCHIFHTVDSPMSKTWWFVLDGSELRGSKNLQRSKSLHSCTWAQLEKSGLQIRRSSAEILIFSCKWKFQTIK